MGPRAFILFAPLAPEDSALMTAITVGSIEDETEPD